MLPAFDLEARHASDYLQTRVREVVHPMSPDLTSLCDYLRPTFEAGQRQAAHLSQVLAEETPPRVLVAALRAARGITTLVSVFVYGRALRTSIHGTGRRDPAHERRVWGQLRDLAMRGAA
jgi:hypothetical protein